MKKAFRLGLLVTVVSFIWYHFDRRVNPRDEDIDRLISPEDTLPYNPSRIDSGGGKDTVVILPRDTTPYKGNYIDVN
jgi:hypothetical protein